MSGAPVDFAPSEAIFPCDHSARFFYPDTLLTLIGGIDYGRGVILLAPFYPVDLNHAFADLFFYNLVKFRSAK
ncbi:hypothetical protein L0128_14205 [candidate division KSB1 bacterium]|nr:hypothetical protein [candidate division KSB1 bacterium]